MAEKAYAVYRIEYGIMQEISVYRNKESAEQYYEDLIDRIGANYPRDAGNILHCVGLTIHVKKIGIFSSEKGDVDGAIGWNCVEIKE